MELIAEDVDLKAVPLPCSVDLAQCPASDVPKTAVGFSGRRWFGDLIARKLQRENAFDLTAHYTLVPGDRLYLPMLRQPDGTLLNDDPGPLTDEQLAGLDLSFLSAAIVFRGE